MLVAGNLLWVMLSLDTLVKAHEPVKRSEDRLRVTGELIEAMTDAETGQRGFLLTGDARFLKPYYSAQVRLDNTRRDMKAMLAGVPLHAEKLSELEAAISAKLLELEETVARFSAGDRTGALASVQDGAGKKLMDDVRRIVDELRQLEQQSLATSFARHAKAVEHAYLTFGISAIVNLLLILTVGMQIRQAARDAAEGEARLHARNGELASALDATARQSRQIAALSELSRFLQSSRDLDEALTLLNHYLPTVFEARAGSLYLTAASRNQLRLACTWGEISHGDHFEPSDCWALRRGQPYTQPDNAGPTRCEHLPDAAAAGSRCLPITAHGEVIGVVNMSPRPDSTLDEFQIANTLEQVALSIGNLQLRETLRQQSVRDALTGLFNRRYLEESLTRELSRAERKGATLALFMIDVDHFKQFNDRHGHEAGDTVLREVGRVLREHSRDADIAARYGGEEFTLVLPEADTHVALERAETLRAAIEALSLSFRGSALGSLTISIGLATYPAHGDTPAALMHRADQALYTAKRSGRNRVHLAEISCTAIAA